jgi:hypothetical protein
MAISSRLGTFGERRIQSNLKWEDYHYSTIYSQIPAYCLYCREGIRTHKKKLDNWSCQYCGKELQYFSKLKQHLSRKTSCNKTFFQQKSVVPEISQQCLVVPEISQQYLAVPEISQQYLEKNTVLIRLSLI